MTGHIIDALTLVVDLLLLWGLTSAERRIRNLEARLSFVESDVS